MGVLSIEIFPALDRFAEKREQALKRAVGDRSLVHFGTIVEIMFRRGP